VQPLKHPMSYPVNPPAAGRQHNTIPPIPRYASPYFHQPPMGPILQPKVVAEHLGARPKFNKFGYSAGNARGHPANVALRVDACQPLMMREVR
jgi:hypothetical protein